MATRAVKTLRPEDEVSHYRIVGALGAGGMGEVYLAQDQSLDRNVALKVLPPDVVRSEERLRRFVREAKSASSLSHPNIVTIYEIGADEVRSPTEPPSGPVHFISMELVRGKTLSTLIHDDKVDLRTLLGYLAQAADGLAKAHAAGIVHRDLKPSNIMVSADGFAKVLDFGLAKLTERTEAGLETTATATLAADTQEGMVVGTAGYMSPEQIQGKAADPRSDIFSFGCILYEAATRQRPFAADTTIDTLHKILNDKPVPVEELNPKAPSDLRRLIRRCLAKNPDQRLQSMKDLALELREIVDEYEELSASASSGGTTSAVTAAAAPRSRVPIVIGAVVLGAGIVVGWWGLERARQASREQPFQTMEMTTVTSRGDVRDCALSADGRYLAYLAGNAGQFALHVRQVATGSDVEVVPASNAGVQSPSFSPDGNYLYYLARKPDAQNYRALYQVPSLGGTPQQRAFDVDSRVTFRPDGHQIAFWRGVMVKRELHLVVVDLDSGQERTLAVITEREFVGGDPVWSPDGKRIAAAVHGASGRPHATIAWFDAVSGRRTDQPLGLLQIRDIAWLRDGSGLVATAWSNFASLNSQVLRIDAGRSGFQRVTNDPSAYHSITAATSDDALAAVRQIRVENFWIADASGSAPRALTSVSTPGEAPFDAAAVDTGTLVYMAARDGGTQMWAQSVSGGEPRALTRGTMFSMNPRAAGGSVVFDRVEVGGLHVWRVNPDGSGLRQLTTGGGEQARDASLDGRFALIQRFDSTGVWLLSLESGTLSRCAPNITTGLGFSRDGAQLVLGREEHGADGLEHVKWLVYPVRGGAPTDSVVLPGRTTNPKWSPDGRGILFQDAIDPAHNVGRQALGAGRAAEPVTHFTEGRVLNFAPSPDGRRLAVSCRVGSAENVWITDADGGHPVQVTRFASERVFEIVWLPDSRRLAVGAGTESSDAVLIRKFR